MVKLTYNTTHVTIDALARDMVSALHCVGLASSRITVSADFNGVQLTVTIAGVVAVLGDVAAKRGGANETEVVGAYLDVTQQALKR